MRTAFIFTLYLYESSFDKKKTRSEFQTSNAASRIPFEEWLTKVKLADWETPAYMQDTFGSADLLAKNSSRVVFYIGGNNYRMICNYAFGKKKYAYLFVGLELMLNMIN